MATVLLETPLKAGLYLLFFTLMLACDAVTVYKLVSGYNITYPILSSIPCDKFCRKTCLMSCGCEPDCKSVSVNQPLQQCHLHPNVIYDEDAEFSATSSDWEYHQENTNTIKKGNWTLVFRVTPFIGQAALTTWQNSGHHDDHPANKHGVPPGCATTNSSKSCDRHFRSKILDDWGSYNIKEVKLELFKNGVSQHHIIFDGTGTDFTSWMSKDKLISSSWTDLVGNSFNYFEMIGHNMRTFFINKSYNSCPEDYGWLVVVDSILGHGCAYEAVATSIPVILYSSGTTHTNINNYVQADVMAVFVKLG